MKTTYPTPATKCPACGRHGDRATWTNTDDRPEPDCISICYGCYAVSLFTADMQLRPPTEEERRELAGPEFAPILKRAIAALKKVKGT